jgi:uncharacterized protein (TIGR01777 family)
MKVGHMKTKILITGGTGLVGMRLSEKLADLGYEVLHLSRKENLAAPFPAYSWDIDKGYMDPRALSVDHIIHLAGESVAAGRWTQSRKERLYKSRIESTKLLAKHINEKGTLVQSFITASAIGIYGADTGADWVTEESPAGNDFLAELVKDWEASTEEISSIPVTKIRIGVVLSNEGGALPQLLLPIRFGLGASLGDGKQYISWIHIDDLIMIIIHLLHYKQGGIFNAVAPQPETNKEFTKHAAKQINRPLLLPNVPGFAMKLVLGEMSQIVLGGNRVSSDKIRSTGYEFRFDNLTAALKNLLS